MRVDSDRLRDIVERASTLRERCTGAVVPDSAPADAGVVTARIDRWRRATAGPDAGFFETSLAWSNIDPAALATILGPVRLRDSTRLPGWALLFRDALAAIDDDPDAVGDRALDANAPLPFEVIVVPFVRLARARVLDASRTPADRFSAKALARLERALLRDLVHLIQRVIFVEFSVFRSRADHRPHAIRMASRYERFIAEMFDGGLLRLFERYPALARVIAVRTEFWIAASRELIDRVDADHAALNETFGNGMALGRVASLATRVSDSHAGGRTVSILRFESGTRVVYKPRSLALDRVFGEVVARVNGLDIGPTLRALTVIDRGDYGWMEFAAHASCATTPEVDDYYRRAGMLLCLTYVLRGADFHDGNVIAAGPHPMIIDLEMLLAAQPEDAAPGDAQTLASRAVTRQMGDSVFRTGLLPNLVPHHDGARLEQGGLGGTGLVPDVRRRGWQHVNTDYMAPAEITIPPARLTNVPMLDDAPCYADDHVGPIVDGFTAMYRALQHHGSALLADVLGRFAQCDVRVLLRPTRVYANLLDAATHPSLLRDGVDRSLSFEILRRSFARSTVQPRFWRAIDAELADLEQMDVPRFAARSASRDLPTGCGVIAGYCEVSGFDGMRTALAALADADLTRQREYVTYAFATLRAKTRVAGRRRAASSEALTANAAIDEALRIADELRCLSLEMHDGNATWLTFAATNDRALSALAPVRSNLYEGRAGIAMFLAAVEHVTGGAGFRPLLDKTLAPLLSDLRAHAHRDTIARETGLGGGSGIGGLVYGLVAVARFLDDPDMLRAAHAAAASIDPAAIPQNAELDLITGVAGTVLALLALDAADPTSDALERAVACGEHIIGRIGRRTDGSTGWPGPEVDRGFAHGSDGILYALDRLARRSGMSAPQATNGSTVDDFASLGPSAARAEHAITDWSTQPMDERFRWSWCHGLAGIGLAHAAAGSAAALDVLSLAPAADGRVREVDHLCCGTFGVVDLEITAAQTLGRADLLQSARLRASRVVVRAQTRGTYGFAQRDDVHAPGFFQGLSGIGYELLRLAAPERVPSALSWS